jgi:hypothetical protein
MPEFPYLSWPVFRRSVVAAFRRSLTLATANTIRRVRRTQFAGRSLTGGLCDWLRELSGSPIVSDQLPSRRRPRAGCGP